MIDVNYYMQDGANWQAQCVLAYIRRNFENILDKTWDKDKKSYNGSITVGRFENCREQGYIFTLWVGINQIKHYAVYEHRNVDKLCVVAFDGSFINTPTINDIPMTDKYDITMSFGCGEVIACGKWIADQMVMEIDKVLKNR